MIDEVATPLNWNNVWIAINTFLLLCTAALAWWKARKVEAKIAETHTDVIANKNETAELKVHTNSITSELVKAREELAGLRATEAVRTEVAKNEAEQAKGALAAEMRAAVETVNGTHKEPQPVEVVNKKAVPVRHARAGPRKAKRK